MAAQFVAELRKLTRPQFTAMKTSMRERNQDWYTDLIAQMDALYCNEVRTHSGFL
jgi:hypothetical protein